MKKVYFTVDEDGTEYVWKTIYKPVRDKIWGEGFWNGDPDETENTNVCFKLEEGAIKTLTGKELTWEDEPLEISVNII